MSQTIRALLRRLCAAADPHGQPPDAELLDRFARHADAAAFAELVARHGPMVLGVCRRLLGDDHDAEDAFQAAFLVLARRAAALESGVPVGPWLHGVAGRVAAHARADRARRHDRERRATAMPAADTTPAAVWDDLRPVLDEEVGRLPEKYRAAVVLCYLGGKTYDEAAREIGCPKGTVATRLAKARELLRDRLAGRGVALSAAGLAALLADHARAVVPPPLAAAAVDAATSATASPAVAALTEGVLKTMPGSKLKFVGALAVAGVVLAAAAGLAYRAGDGPAPGADPPVREPAKEVPVMAPGGWVRVTMTDRALLFRPDGTGMVETAGPAYSAVVPSPDGKRIAGTRPAGDRREVYVADADGSNVRRVSPEGARALDPSWSPDGKRVAFLARVGDQMQVHVADGDGSNVRKLTDGPHGARDPKFGADGRLAYLLLGKPEFKRESADLVVHDDRTETTTLLVKDSHHTGFAWSPDGTTIAYGKPEAIVFHDLKSGKAQEVPFAALDPRLTNFAALDFGWSPDGRAVACRMLFWGGRRANGPKMFGDEEVFVFSRAGKPYWFAAGEEVRRVEWLRDRPPPAVEIRGADGNVFVAADEIRAYDWDTHTLTLVPKARERLAAELRQAGSLVRGVPFTVAVDGKAVYAGHFTTVLSSGVIKGPVIEVDLPLLDEKLGAEQLRIQIGYPGRTGDDPDIRPDRRVRDALEASGRLKKPG